MDGFDGSKGVVILAATNRPESLISNDETFQQACDDDLMRRLALPGSESGDAGINRSKWEESF